MSEALTKGSRYPLLLSGRARKQRWIECGVIVVFWGAIALLTIAEHTLNPRFGEPGGLLPGEGLQITLEYAFWALLTPGIFWLSHRLSLEDGRWPRHLFLHVLIAISVAIAINVFSLSIFSAVVAADWAKNFSITESIMSLFFLDELIISAHNSLLPTKVQA